MTLIRRSLLALAAATALAAPAAVTAADRTGGAEIGMGDPNAKVKVIEYASVTCPHCAQFNADVFPAFKKKYVDSGQVYYVFREFPTQPAELAVAGFLIARCSGTAKYMEVVDTLFRGQKALMETSNAQKFLLDAGKAGGLDEAAVRACLADNAAVDALEARVKRGIEVDKVEATPTFIIGGTKLEGSQSLAELDAVIQPLLRR
jgi:protein-disulfide isomerase